MAAPQEQDTRKGFLKQFVAFGEASVTSPPEIDLSQLVFGKKEMTHPVELINKTRPVKTDAWAEIGDNGKETGTYSYAFTTINNNTIIKGAEALFLQWTFEGLSASEVGLVKLLFHSDNKLAITAASLPFVQAAADTLAAQPGMEEVVNTLQQALTDVSKHISDASSSVASLTRRDFLKILATFTGAGAIVALLDFKNIRRFLDDGGAQNVFNMLPDEVQKTIYAAMKVEDAGGIGGGGPTETPEPTVIASPSGTPTATVTPYTIYLPYIQYGDNLDESTPTETAMLIEPTTTSSVVPTTAVPSTAIPVTETPTPKHTLTITPSATHEPTKIVEMQKRLTLKEIGKRHKADIGTTLQGNSAYYDKKLLNRIKTDYSQIFPGTFFVTTIEKYAGQDKLARHIINDIINPNKMQLVMHPGFSHVDVPDRLSAASNDEVQQYMRETINMYLDYVQLAQKSGKPPLVQFLTEALFYDNNNGQGRYMETPFQRAFFDNENGQNKLISRSYLLFIEEAAKRGLRPGVNFIPQWSETDCTRPGGHTSYLVQEGKRAKQEIADALKISVDEVVLDIASQHHIVLGNKPSGWEFMRDAPSYDDMVAAYNELKGLGGKTRIHCDSLHVLGAANEDQIVEQLGIAMKAAFDTNSPSILLWDPLNRVSPTGDTPHFQDQGLYDAQYAPTAGYNSLITKLT